MTEAQWLSSDDPAAMLAFLTQSSFGPAGLEREDEERRQQRSLRPSDRKLLLFCYAWRRAAGMGGKNGGEREDELPPSVREAHGSAAAWAASLARVPGVGGLPGATAAAVLRCVVGNPFRPVTLPKGPPCFSCAMLGKAAGPCEGCDRLARSACPWLTPDVLTLARAAYEQRGRKCSKCDGKGNGWNYRFGHKATCSACNAGTVEDGTLDPARLAVLSDALEEAGCDNEAILLHLRRPPSCDACQSTGQGVDEYAGTVIIPGGCPRCHGHVGPHYRGCRAVDLILGKS